MTQASEVYAFLIDNPVGAYVAIRNELADEIMETQGGMFLKDEKWCRLYCEKLSPGVIAISLHGGRENETRGGHGPFVSLRFHE